MNLQSMVLVGVVLGSSVVNGVSCYENVYVEYQEEKKEKTYIEQVEKNPNDIEALTELANYYEELWGESHNDFENFNKAEAVCKEIIKVDPNSTALAELYLNCRYKGQYYFYENDDIAKLCSKMEEEFIRLLEIDSDNVEIMLDLADLYSYLYYEEYCQSNYDLELGSFINSDFFGSAENLYFDALSIDEDNMEVRYKLIDLYKNELEVNNDSQNGGNDECFDKIEEQYLEILDIDENYIDARYGLINFYKYCYEYIGIECFDKIEEQYLEILKRETDEEEKSNIIMKMGELYQDIWITSEYVDNRAFEKTEQSYKYLLDIEPDCTNAQSHLTKLYETAYYFSNVNNEQYFEEAVQSYKDYSKNFELYYKENAYFRLAKLYEDKWNKDKSNYTYYYMAEEAFYNSLDFELGLEKDEYTMTSCEPELEVDRLYSVDNALDVCVSLTELYKAKYEFDGDVEALNTGKNLLLEQIPVLYADEMAYVDGEGDKSYIDTNRVETLGWIYWYVWSLDTNDLQYYEKSEKAYLKLWNSNNDYYALFKLGDLYTERWLLDKNKVEYKEKALQCFDEIFDASDKLSEDFWFEEYIYPLLEELGE